jgi:small conductance mechanosensitive channel
MTKDYSRYVFDIGVAYREDVDEVVKVVKQIDEEMRNDPDFKDDILEPIEILGLDQFADSAVIVKARIKTKPIRQWAVGREFNRRLKKRFDELDIEIPFPHTTLYIGADKRGKSQPLNVAMGGNPE